MRITNAGAQFLIFELNGYSFTHSVTSHFVCFSVSFGLGFCSLSVCLSVSLSLCLCLSVCLSLSLLVI